MSETFHLAFPVTDLDETERFYRDVLSCRVGRKNAYAIIMDMQGNQIVGHLDQQDEPHQAGIYPRHFGIIFRKEDKYESLVERLLDAGYIVPKDANVRFAGTELEHRSVFLRDPSGNLLEFKHYRNPKAIIGVNASSPIGNTPL